MVRYRNRKHFQTYENVFGFFYFIESLETKMRIYAIIQIDTGFLRKDEPMKLKTRIFIAFLIIILVPLILSGTVLFGFGMFQVKSIEQRYGVQLETLAPQIRTLVMDVMVMMILILLVTGLALSFWIYRGISTPLYKLTKATKNIRDGNLDFTMEPEGVEEICELCEDFEEMRQRLKVSAEEKVSFDKENKELISNISHDLKTPITAVKGYCEGIMDGVADTPEKMEKYIRTIYNKTIEMDRLINELTFYSKIDTNRIPYTFSKINVKGYFDDAAEEVGLELEAKSVGFGYYNYVADDVTIIADVEQIKRVINNIIGNSVKYMNKPKGLITMRVRDVGDFIQVEIEDNGKGIAAKDLANIFDRFYRTDASRNSSKGGSGIGLSIVKKIMEDHGGKVWATSKEDVGTVMYFVLRKYQEVPFDE